MAAKDKMELTIGIAIGSSIVRSKTFRTRLELNLLMFFLILHPITANLHFCRPRARPRWLDVRIPNSDYQAID